MPSGKIISFLYGEIAPSFRFKTNLVSFATGLSKLLNKTVRKSGGVSNRSGFEYVYEPTMTLANNPKGTVRVFGANLSKEGQESDERDVIFVVPEANGETAEAISSTPYLLAANAAAKDLTNVKISQLGDTLIFSNGEVHWSYKLSTQFVPTGRFEDEILYGPLAISIGGAIVPAPALSVIVPGFSKIVNYRVYQVLRTGEEVFLDEFISTVGNVAIEPVLTSSGAGFMTMVLPLSADARVKHYNIYRASTSAPGVTTGPWGLVGRVPKPAADGNINFTDYLTEPDVTNPPPDEDYLYGEGQAALQKKITSARLIGHYQQRRVVVANPSNSKLGEGSVSVSKVGAPIQLDTQVLFTPAGAFDFKTPIGVKNRVIGILELERLVLLTSDAVVVIKGGEQGMLTPSTVNPHVISYTGCSKKVAPIKGSSYGFFMSKNDEKLMRVSFGLDGNVGVDELSLISDHLLNNKKVKEMALTKGKEDIVWMLKHDGTLVSVTVHEGGSITGWARHETDGFIESITSMSVNKQALTNQEESEEQYESLHISVIRDGVRYIERLTHREDEVKEKYFYADSLMSFGSRFILDEEFSFYRREVDFPEVEDHVGRSANPTTTAIASKRLNLTTAGGWTIDDDITITNLDVGNFQDPAIEKQVIDFYYENAEGIETVLRWTQTGFTNADIAVGRFSEDVPAYMQNVTAQALTAGEKSLIQTRYIRVKNKITGLTHLANKEVSVFADGIVVSSPNNPTYETLTVDALGVLELDDYYAWGIVGLPYTSEMETLDLDTSDNRTLTDSMKLVNRVGVAFHESKGGYVGQTGQEDLSKMEEFMSREDETIEEVSKNINEHVVVPFPAQWEKTGRVLIRQVDPLPMTVLAVYPKGIAGD